MSGDDAWTNEDQVAFDFCVQVLTEEPRLPYKEARREARQEKGVGVRRHIWTAARRKLGLASDAEPDEAQPTPRVADPVNEGPPPPAAAWSPPKGPAYPAHYSASPPRAEDRQRGDDDGQRSAAGPAWRNDRPRPAWATPREALRPKEDADPLVAPRPYAPPVAPPSAPRPPMPPPGYQRHSPPGYSSPPRAPLHPPAYPHSPPQGQPPAYPPAYPPRTPPPFRPREAASGPPPGMLTPESNPNSAIEWMVEYLRTVNRDASFGEVRQAAETVGHTVFPSTFGRAQAIVGLHLDQSTPAAPARPTAQEPMAAPRVPARSPIPPQTPQSFIPPQRPPQAAPIPGRPASAAATITDPVQGLKVFQAALERAERDQALFVRAMRSMLTVVERALDSE